MIALDKELLPSGLVARGADAIQLDQLHLGNVTLLSASGGVCYRTTVNDEAFPPERCNFKYPTSWIFDKSDFPNRIASLRCTQIKSDCSASSMDKFIHVYNRSGTQMLQRQIVDDGDREIGEKVTEEWVRDGPLDVGPGGRCSVVMHAIDYEHNVYGIIVRVGHLCQGVLRAGQRFAAERWEGTQGPSFMRVWGDPPDGDGDTMPGLDSKTSDEPLALCRRWMWRRVFKVGPFFLPCALAFQTLKLKGGELLHYQGLQWKVSEVVRW